MQCSAGHGLYLGVCDEHTAGQGVQAGLPAQQLGASDAHPRRPDRADRTPLGPVVVNHAIKHLHNIISILYRKILNILYYKI